MLREFSHRGSGEYRPSTMIYDAIASFTVPLEPAEKRCAAPIGGGVS